MIDRRVARRGKTGETGAILPFLALGFVSILLFLIMTVDVGVGYMARGQLQNIADSASRAALEFRTDNNMNPGQAAAAAVGLARQMTAAAGIPNADIVFGDFDFSSNTFRPGGTELNPAVRVVASRMAGQGAGGNPIRGLLGDMDVMASSTAMFKCRAIVLVEDVTASFGEEIELAKDALQALVDEMASQALPGDHIGLVRFDNAAEVLLPLTPMSQAQQELSGIIDSLRQCGPTEAGCQGTDQAVGIRAATDLHAESQICNDVTDRLTIVISDGQPCGVPPDSRGPSDQLAADAQRAAQEALAAGISIASVFYDAPDGDGATCGGVALATNPTTFSMQLVKGDLGRSFVTPDARQIRTLLLDILKLFKVSVVG